MEDRIKDYIEVLGQRLKLEEKYYVYYVGKQKLPKKDIEIFQALKRLPEKLARKEINKLPPEKNPDILPLTGYQICEHIFDKGYIPIFDKYFKKTRKLTLIKKEYYTKLLEKMNEK